MIGMLLIRNDKHIFSKHFYGYLFLFCSITIVINYRRKKYILSHFLLIIHIIDQTQSNFIYKKINYN